MKNQGDVPQDALEPLVPVTVELVDHVRKEIQLIGFWESAQKQDELRGWIIQFLDAYHLIPFEQLPDVADRIVELARVNHPKLVE